ncbi:GyrI-like domain-containing protein [Modestobacter sp. URMC 112]
MGPLEGLWTAEDPGAFVAGDKSAWHWTLLVSQPAWVTPDLVGAAVQKAAAKAPAGLKRVRLESYTEGTSVQVLHVGSFESEAPVLARLHSGYLPAHRLTFDGPHHEIYLSDARRTDPAELRTVLRQPVSPVP